MENFIITIDGPAGSGKTTIARMLAEKLNIPLLESGSLYRTATYLVIRKQELFKNKKDLIYFLENSFKHIKINLTPSGTEIYSEGELLRDVLRSEEVEKRVSEISALKEVREFLTTFMKDLTKNMNFIAEGRDMGTVVFPFAKVKIFLTADEKIRAKRRFKEKEKITYEEVLENIKLRDKLDSERKIAPLIVPKDAYVIDTSYLTPKEVLERILKIIENVKNEGRNN